MPVGGGAAAAASLLVALVWGSLTALALFAINRKFKHTLFELALIWGALNPNAFLTLVGWNVFGSGFTSISWLHIIGYYVFLYALFGVKILLDKVRRQ